MTESQGGKDGPEDPGRGGVRAYQGAMEAVLSVPIAMGLGYWADSRFGTEPICMLVGVALGFVTFVVRLVKMRHEIDGQDEDE